MTVNEIIAEKFTDHITRVFKNRDTTAPLQVAVYPAVKVADDIFIVLERDSRRECEDGYRGNIELHVLDVRGGWAGGGCTVYGPEVRYSDEIIPAHVNGSSYSDNRTDSTRATAQMALIAADLADAWTVELMPQLVAELDEIKRAREEHRAEMAAAREARNAEIARRKARMVGPGNTVRVHHPKRSNPVTGKLVAVDGDAVIVQTTYREQPHRFNILEITSLETKLIYTGRFDRVF